MSKTYKIKRYTKQRITFNSPILYSTVVKYITSNSKNSRISSDKREAYNFESLEDSVNLLIKLNEERSFESDWEVVEISGDSELLVNEDTITYYKNKRTIEKYKQEVEELNRKIKFLEAGSPYKRITIGDVKIGNTLFIVRAMMNGTHLSTEQVVIKSDIKDLKFDVKAVEVDTIKIIGNQYYSDGNLYLSDAGIIPNNYNKSKTFKTLEDAESYMKELKPHKQG